MFLIWIGIMPLKGRGKFKDLSNSSRNNTHISSRCESIANIQLKTATKHIETINSHQLLVNSKRMNMLQANCWTFGCIVQNSNCQVTLFQEFICCLTSWVKTNSTWSESACSPRNNWLIPLTKPAKAVATSFEDRCVAGKWAKWVFINAPAFTKTLRRDFGSGRMVSP